MHRVLTVADILWEVFFLLQRPELGSVVHVCRLWYMVGLPFLWRQVDFRIFRFFGDFLRSELSYKYSVSLPLLLLNYISDIRSSISFSIGR